MDVSLMTMRKAYERYIWKVTLYTAIKARTQLDNAFPHSLIISLLSRCRSWRQGGGGGVT